MELSVNLGYYSKYIGLETAARMAAIAGIRTLDFTPALDGDDWQEKTEEAARIFDRYNLTVYQGHAPFNRYGSHGDVENHKKLVWRSLEAAAKLNSKVLVVHGDEFDFDGMTYTPEAVLAYNYEYFVPVVERAAKLGVKIAFENLFTDWNRPRNCSKVEELSALMDSFHAPETVVCCWDFGHAAVAFKKEQPAELAKMASRIEATHVHDNYLNSDMHLMPFFGNIDWNACMKAFAKGGNCPVLSFEFAHGALPVEIVQDTLRLLASTGEHLLSMM